MNRNRLIQRRKENAEKSKETRIKRYDFCKQLLASLSQVNT
jgi:hypothetical protein